ncbi:MAG: wbmP [Ignavibacteriae bacterium]|nr:MAG: wbmP [Ignavibacteriota bacterium]
MNGTKKSVAIHQPSFFPWLGFFDKIKKADIFVILDNVQFPKTGGFWANRVKILISGRPDWMTMPIIRSYSGLRNINEMEINNLTPWREKLLKTIEINYKKAEHFNRVFPIIRDLLNFQTDSLLEYNLNTINAFRSILEIKKPDFYLASSLNTSGKATELLVSIVKAVNCNEYICGGGAANYQVDEKFEAENITLTHQNFVSPVYKQFNTEKFESGLSIIDVLFNCGIPGVKKLLMP